MALIVPAPRSCRGPVGPCTSSVRRLRRGNESDLGAVDDRGARWTTRPARPDVVGTSCDDEQKQAGPRLLAGAHENTLNVGGDLLSHTLASAVPSALEGLASGFGMGPGVPPPPKPPTTLSNYETIVDAIMRSGSHSGCKQLAVN